ncbi:hypothetical protein E2C01_008879 [Portunus trituberculatus]|uniref:Uncharacterized protein n=1 Tax=Portunus trituberculatus TaxID=210409 RepID=A0A5B7D3I8_PORTR|nr:hypothetical protein [Portunus trituberculatus]
MEARKRRVCRTIGRVEVWVIEIAQEPEHPGPQHFPQQQDERGKIEHVHHPNQPVDEHGGARSCLEAHLTLKKRTYLESGIKEGEGADVQPPASNEWKHPNLHYAEQGNLHHHIAQPQRSLRPATHTMTVTHFRSTLFLIP